jgi:hypothetical protein
MTEFTKSVVTRHSHNEAILREACAIALKEGRRFEIREFYSVDWWTEFKIWRAPDKTEGLTTTVG